MRKNFYLLQLWGKYSVVLDSEPVSMAFFHVSHLLLRCLIAGNKNYFKCFSSSHQILKKRKILHMHIALIGTRSCKRSNTLFQKSLLLFLTWREYFSSSQLTSLNKAPLLLQDLGVPSVRFYQVGIIELITSIMNRICFDVEKRKKHPHSSKSDYWPGI